MAEAASAAQSPKKKVALGKKTMNADLAQDETVQGVVAAVAASIHESVSSSSSSPVSTLQALREERKAAKKEAVEKTKELRAYAKRVSRLQQRAKKLSDDSLIVEYARRQAAKEKKRQLSGST